NITVAFFNDSDSTSCDSADTSKALVLTTRTIPASFVCFNVSDLFTQSNTTGFSNGSTPYSHPEQLELPNRVDWLISNLDNYDSNANYSRVWYEQNGPTGKVEEGVNGQWVFYIYAFEDCKQVGGDAFDQNKNPWFENSCQTKDGGQCRTVPNTIKSFGLNKADEYNKGHGGCATWAYMGDAKRL
ncbi:uncharacterized protein CC84DRAFT_1076306, partial [Paraphaeosphaeria sporulosa]